MKNLVRIIEKDDTKVVQWHRDSFDTLQQLDERVPTREGPAKDNAPVHTRLNDSDYEAEKYFENFVRKENS